MVIAISVSFSKVVAWILSMVAVTFRAKTAVLCFLMFPDVSCVCIIFKIKVSINLESDKMKLSVNLTGL